LAGQHKFQHKDWWLDEKNVTWLGTLNLCANYVLYFTLPYFHEIKDKDKSIKECKDDGTAAAILSYYSTTTGTTATKQHELAVDAVAHFLMDITRHVMEEDLLHNRIHSLGVWAPRNSSKWNIMWIMPNWCNMKPISVIHPGMVVPCIVPDWWEGILLELTLTLKVIVTALCCGKRK
jgi:hypothetical protein